MEHFESGTTPKSSTKSLPSVKRETGKRKRSSSDQDLVDVLRKSHLFALFISEEWENAKTIEFLGLTQAFAHTPKKIIGKKLKEFEKAASSQDDTEVLAYLTACREKFSSKI